MVISYRGIVKRMLLSCRDFAILARKAFSGTPESQKTLVGLSGFWEIKWV
jgi:hypothetical protein